MEALALSALWPEVSAALAQHVATMASLQERNGHVTQALSHHNSQNGHLRITANTSLVDGNGLPMGAVPAELEASATMLSSMAGCPLPGPMLTPPALLQARSQPLATCDSQQPENLSGTQASSVIVARPVPTVPNAAFAASFLTESGTSSDHCSSSSSASLQDDTYSAFRPPNQASTSYEDFILCTLNNLVVPHDVDASSDGGASAADASASLLADPNREVLLCQVCSDRASGFHYGIYSCEGCKGFFRRSINKEIQYRACTKSQQCAIVRNNRNRCQDCRLKKCMAVGMSRDAVRFGRVPKREKIKMKEERERDRIRVRRDELALELEDNTAFVRSVERAYAELGDSLRRHIDGLNSDASEGNTCQKAGAQAYRTLLTAVYKYSENNTFFQVLVLRFVSLPMDAAVLPRVLLLGSCDHAAESLFKSIENFIHYFRSNQLDEHQMALLTAVVLCKAGTGVSSTEHPLEEEDLVYMLRAKLDDALRWSWANAKINQFALMLLGQNLTTHLGDLTRLNTAYLNYVRSSQLPQSSNGPTRAVADSFKKTQSPEAGGMKPPELPALRKALEQPPRNLANGSAHSSPVDTFREQHKLIASLLEQPPKPPLRLALQKQSTAALLVKPEPESNDEPLNLCVRDSMAR